MKNVQYHFLLILMVVAVGILIAVPAEYKRSFSNILPTPLKFIADAEVSKGLDLAGGVGLDFKVDTSKVPPERVQEVLNGIVQVVSTRVNALGVSEPDIVLTQFGEEHHIKVTLAGVSDIQEAKEMIGKTIQLEFKVPKDPQELDDKTAIEKRAKDALSQAKTAEVAQFDVTAAEWRGQGEGRVVVDTKSQFLDEIPAAHQPAVEGAKVPGVVDAVYEVSMSTLEDGTLTSDQGYVVMAVKEVKSELRDFPKNAEDFIAVAQDVSDTKDISLSMIKSTDASAETDYIKTALTTLEEGQVSDVLDVESGLAIVRVQEKFRSGEELVRASHILLKTEAPKPLKEITTNMTAEQKKAAEEENVKIQEENNAISARNAEVRKKMDGIVAELGGDTSKFAELAKKYSEDTSKDEGGDLGFFGKSMMVKPFEDAAFGQDAGALSQVVESQYGYHLIHTTAKKPADQTWMRLDQMIICYAGAKDSSCASATRTKDEARTLAESALKRVREEKKYTYSYALFSTVPDQWKPAEIDGKQLTGEYFQRAEVVFAGLFPTVSIGFNAEGAKLFEDLTGKYIGQPMAIFVGGSLISAPRINERIIGGQAVIQGNFTVREATELARDLNTGAIPAPIYLAGEEIVGPELGQIALDQSLKAGMIGLLILAVFMIVYYRVQGLIAVLALLVYAIMFFVFIKILPGFNLTLAGAAAIILSIGMAVDGNVLIFERLREEMKSDQKLSVAISKAVSRAWPAIRDTHVSSLITGFLLFFIGADMVRGFAVFLIVGILFSLVTSVYVTHVFMLMLARTNAGATLLSPSK